MTVRLREATAADADTVGHLAVASRRLARRGVYSDAYLDALDPKQAVEEARTHLEAPPDGWRMWVAEDDEVVAYATARPSPDDPRAAEVDELYVAPDRFRQGIGSQLLARVEAQIRASGFSAAILWVREDDRGAQAFYFSNGWTPDGAEMQLRKDRVRTYQRWGKALETEARG